MAGGVTLGPHNFFTRHNQVFSFAALERPNIGLSKKYRVGGVCSSGLGSRSQIPSPTPSKKLTPKNVDFLVEILTLGFGLK